MESVLTNEQGVDLYEQLSELWSKAGILLSGYQILRLC